MKSGIVISLTPEKILGCSSKTCNEADLGLETLKSRRDRAKLKWWYKVCRLPDNRYPCCLVRSGK